MTAFNLLSFAQGKSRAETSVPLYFNEDAARRADEATAYTVPEIAGQEPEKYVADIEAFNKAREEVKASAVTIHLRGLDEGRVDEIREQYEIPAGSEVTRGFNLSDTRNEDYLIAVLVEAFDKAVDAEGNEDISARPTDNSEEALAVAHDYWKSFKRSAPASQWPKLLSEVLNLIFVSFVIDDAVDAGFLAES